MAGLMVIGCIKLFGIDALQSSGLERAVASARAETAMALFFALANGLGRIGWGMISSGIAYSCFPRVYTKLPHTPKSQL